MTNVEKIIVLDYGSQYNQLITRRIYKLVFTQIDFINDMMLCLVQDNISSASCWQDILFQILQVDIFPDILRHGKRFFAIADCVVIIVVIRIFKLQLPANQQIYVSDFFDLSIYVDADPKMVERWYIERFESLLDTAFKVEKVTDIDLLIGWQL
jgi:hypothetical protein